MSGKRIICAINAARRTADGSGTWLVVGVVSAEAGVPENKSRREFSALIGFWNMAHKKEHVKEDVTWYQFTAGCMQECCIL